MGGLIPHCVNVGVLLFNVIVVGRRVALRWAVLVFSIELAIGGTVTLAYLYDILDWHHILSWPVDNWPYPVVGGVLLHVGFAVIIIATVRAIVLARREARASRSE